jgi:O-antigen/teichoic acid export membrane protein
MLSERLLRIFKIVPRNGDQGLFARNVISTFVVQVISLCLSIGTTALIARRLGPEGKGLCSLILLVPGMLGAFLNAGIGVANVYFVGSRQLDVETVSAHSLTMSGVTTALGVAIIGILWATGWSDGLLPGVPIGLVWLATVGLPIGLISGYFNGILQGLQEIRKINAVSLLQACLTFVLTVLFVVKCDFRVIGAILSTMVASASAVFGLSFCLFRYGGTFTPAWNRPVMHKMLTFGLKGHIGNVLQYFNYRLDLFLVNYFLGAAGVGIYAISVGMAELLWYFPNAIGFAIFPKAASCRSEVMDFFVPRVFRIALGVTALGAIGLVVFGKVLIQWVFTSSFDSSYIPMVALLPGVVLLGGAKVLSNDMAGRGYPQYNSINAGVASLFTVILDLMLIPSYGVLGAAVASTMSYSVTFVIALCFYRVVNRRCKGALFG